MYVALVPWLLATAHPIPNLACCFARCAFVVCIQLFPLEFTSIAQGARFTQRALKAYGAVLLLCVGVDADRNLPRSCATHLAVSCKLRVPAHSALKVRQVRFQGYLPIPEVGDLDIG